MSVAVMRRLPVDRFRSETLADTTEAPVASDTDPESDAVSDWPNNNAAKHSAIIQIRLHITFSPFLRIPRKSRSLVWRDSHTKNNCTCERYVFGGIFQ